MVTKQPVNSSRNEPTTRGGPVAARTGLADGWISWMEASLPLLLLVWTFLLCLTPLANMDIWWHLRTGQLILERGTVPQLDWYTYTGPEQTWIDLHWGFQLVVAAIYALGGVDGLILLKGLLLAAGIGLALRAVGHELPVWTKLLLWLLPVITIYDRNVMRPEVFSFLFLASALWIVAKAERQPRLIWLFPLLLLVWVNIHGLFVLGLVVLASHMIDVLTRAMAQGRWGLEPLSAETAGWLGIALPLPGDGPHPISAVTVLLRLLWPGLFALAACVVNPYLEEGALFPLVLFRKFGVEQELYGSVGEFMPPIQFFREHGLRGVSLPASIGVWCLATLTFMRLLRKKRVSVLRLTLFVAFSFLAWQAVRNLYIFAMVGGAVACANCADLGRLGGGFSLAVESDSRNMQRRAYAYVAGTWLLLLGLIVAIPTGYWAALDGGSKTFGLGERADWYAHEPARFAGQQGMPNRAFVSHFGQAAVYIFHNAPESRVYLDGRLEVHSAETYTSYRQITRMMAAGDRRWEELVRDANGQLPAIILDSRVAVPQINGLVQAGGWRPVYADRTGVVFIETRLANELGLRTADPGPLLETTTGATDEADAIHTSVASQRPRT